MDESVVRRWSNNEARLRQQEAVKTVRGLDRARLLGAGKKVLNADVEQLVFDWIVQERHHRRRVTRETIKKTATDLFREVQPAVQFRASSGWCNNFMKRFNLATRLKTHQSQKTPEELVPKLIDFLLYLKSYFRDHPSDLANIVAMDETAVWFDSTSNRTVDVAGSRTVSLASTGHEKLNVTVALSAAANGDKKKPFIVFKGKGKTPEDRELKARRDIIVTYSDNGWFNDGITMEWLQRIMGNLAFTSRLLIWDSYRCHISEAVQEDRRRKKIDVAVIPGGCTGLIQAPDVSWNRPFKTSMRNQYDEWLRSGEKTYTAAGNVRAVSKSQLCDMVVKAWEDLSSDIIVKSFQCCGLVPQPVVDDITCFKEGRPAASGRDALRQALEAPAAQPLNDITVAEDELEHGALVFGNEPADNEQSATEQSASEVSDADE